MLVTSQIQGGSIKCRGELCKEKIEWRVEAMPFNPNAEQHAPSSVVSDILCAVESYNPI